LGSRGGGRLVEAVAVNAAPFGDGQLVERHDQAAVVIAT
jgi:hypothetical protein